MKKNKNNTPNTETHTPNTESWGILNDGNLTPMENDSSSPQKKKEDQDVKSEMP